MAVKQVPTSHKTLTAAATFTTVAVLGVAWAEAGPVTKASHTHRSAGAPSVTLPPRHARFDYQIGGAYRPPTGVRIVSRDREAAPASGLYNICYVNAFQVQPGERHKWARDLLLRDADGKLVIDEDWNEPLLDIRTADKRRRIAKKVNGWIDGCAAKGFDAVEPDNYDSFSRSKKLLKKDDAKRYIKLLADHSHARRLAVGQKNTVELAPAAKALGLDFAVAEECGQYRECGDYTKSFGRRIVDIEYTDAGMRRACDGWGDKVGIVRRDRDVTPAGSSKHVFRTCWTPSRAAAARGTGPTLAARHAGGTPCGRGDCGPCAAGPGRRR
ncbi:endo alpha-1,4 polygalactosaminidase [Wenjunlia tyrosinilytica]|uniref:Glycoside-hydrolase family GH114 TIM-barrel domain-containing protein n=1 Tax=Wenjunlia tyrosinilytica TaxID=1544741 RepID=A0A918DZ47_9ACTN|nr:endo alpha-1,4 polygalactosaminidase [Wenjunlia tyrosinilytica]GGO90321.1 hypothetical protein GCM10012280_35580 [Wenjunlia tyrosinilytica]